MRKKWIGAAAFAMGLAVTVGCGGSEGGLSSASPTAPSATPSLNLAGTWSGTLSIPGESNAIHIRSWVATQSGANVTGPLIVEAGDDDGQELLVTATLAGTVSGAQLTSATFTVAAGAIRGLETCAIRGTGALAAAATSISGPLAVAITPPAAPCVGTDTGVSNTATGTWMFSLTK